MSGIIGKSKARGSGIISTDAPVTSVSGSTGVVADSDIDHDSLGNFASNEHFTQANIAALGTVTSGTISTGTVVDDPTMTQGSDATGDVYYRASDGKLTRLATGADGTVLTSTGVGAVPAFEAVGSFDADQAQAFNTSENAVDFRIASDNVTNMFYVDGSADCVGIGTNTPLATLHVQAPSGVGASIYLYADAGADANDRWQIVNSYASNDFELKSSGVSKFKVSPGIAGAGGNVSGTHGSYHTSSDERVKENITTISDALTKINAIRGVTFDFVESQEIVGKQVGVIAQDLEAAGMTPAVHINEESEEKYKSVLDGNQISAYLIEAVKELSAKVSALENA